MATDTQEISAPSAPDGEAEASAKAERHPFVGDYVADDKGRVQFNVSFPVEALESPEFKPVQAILFLANKAGLKGYGDGDAPEATLGVERAKLKDKDTGELVDNPSAGRLTGTINLVLHTEATMVEARKRGRTGMTDKAKSAATAASKLIKSAISGGHEEDVQRIADSAAAGTIDLKTALMQIAELVG